MMALAEICKRTPEFSAGKRSGGSGTDEVKSCEESWEDPGLPRRRDIMEVKDFWVAQSVFIRFLMQMKPSQAIM